MVLVQEYSLLNAKFKDFLQNLAEEYTTLGKNLCIDGVVSLANCNDDSEQIVLTVHHKPTPEQPSLPPLSYKEPNQVPSTQRYSNTARNAIPHDHPICSTEAQRLERLHMVQAAIYRTVELPGFRPQAFEKVVNKPSNITSQLYQNITKGAGNKQTLSKPTETKRKNLKPEEEPAFSQEVTVCLVCSEMVYGGFSGDEREEKQEVHNKFLCRKCGVPTQHGRWKHRERHQGKLKPFSCNICDKTFSCSNNLKIHMQVHSTHVLSPVNQAKELRDTSSPVICTKCDLMLDNEESLLWHMYKHHRMQDDKWVCTICEQLFLNQEMYEEHKMTHMASLSQYKQPVISISGDENRNNNQVMHNKYHRGLIIKESKRTPTSPDESSNESQPQDYLSTKRAIETNPTTSSRKRRKGNPIKYIQNATDCSDDDDSYLEPKYGSLQVETMNLVSSQSPSQSVSNENDPLMYSYTSDAFASSSVSHNNHDFELPSNPLKNLQSLVYNNSKSSMQYAASTYEALSFQRANNSLNNSTLNATQQAVDDAYKDTEYTCSTDGCTMQFVGFKSFEAHCLEQHKRLPCHLCNKTFNMRRNRTRHISNHNHEKIHQCPECPKKFTRLDSLKEHRLKHTLSYQEGRCRCCGEQYDKKKTLLSHLKKCFRQHRTKSGTIDESLFDNRNATRNGSNMRYAPSGLLLAGINLENNNEPIYPFLLKDTNCLEQSSLDLSDSKEATHIAAKGTTFTHQALVHAPPEAHIDFTGTSPKPAHFTHSTHSPQSAQDLSSTAPELPINLAKSASESPIDLPAAAIETPKDKVPQTGASSDQTLAESSKILL